MKKKIKMAVSSVLCGAFFLCACAGRSEREEQIFTGDKTEAPAYQENLDAIFPAAYSTVERLYLDPGTYISVIGKESNSPYWRQVKAGVRQAAEDLNKALELKGEDKIKVLFNAPAEGENVDEQVNILDEELARYPDVIAIASIDEDASWVQFDLATENGIPVVAFDSGNNYQGIQCTCRTDNRKAAATAAAELGKLMGDGKEVVLFVHDSVSQNGREREEGFRAGLTESCPQAQVVETIYLDRMEELKRKAAAEQLGIPLPDEEGQEEPDWEEKKKQMEEKAQKMSEDEAVAYVLQKYPELSGCFGTNERAVQLGIRALKEAGMEDSVLVTGFDAGKNQLDALADGEVAGLIVQNPFGIGYGTVVAAARTVLGLGNEAQVDTGFVWVTQENRTDKKISPWLYDE